MTNARLLPVGRSKVRIASAFLVMMLGASSTGDAVGALPAAESVRGAKSAVTLSSGKNGGFRYNRTEKCFMRRINRIRRRNGRPGLNWDKQLAYVGRRHARVLARADGVWHDDIGNKVTNWRALGQNTGKGPGCRSLTRAFLRSAAHRANYLGKWRHMGVGVRRRNGYTYVQQIFESRNNPGNIYHRP